jgi:hypothetical protein
MDLQIKPVRKYLTYQLVSHNAICILFTDLTEQPKQTTNTNKQICFQNKELNYT